MCDWNPQVQCGSDSLGEIQCAKCCVFADKYT